MSSTTTCLSTMEFRHSSIQSSQPSGISRDIPILELLQKHPKKPRITGFNLHIAADGLGAEATSDAAKGERRAPVANPSQPLAYVSTGTYMRRRAAACSSQLFHDDVSGLAAELVVANGGDAKFRACPRRERRREKSAAAADRRQFAGRADGASASRSRSSG
ncbi:hypothetical protein EAI_07824 [Harpegnathos saltator]|uniref:Uncharacterized protein n=1 Tax=Harpegnathos saltator TaxID=610380 RepID=E2BLH6_HARSA|nr:hypothetical protein EAI_07824 [Harpegnathos saltator]